MIYLSFIMLSFVMVQNVWAYIDPGTGSYFFQLLIGVLVGLVFSAKLYWHKIMKFFSRKGSDENPGHIETPLPSSFRDPSGYVFVKNSIIYRNVNPVYIAGFQPHALHRLLRQNV